VIEVRSGCRWYTRYAARVYEPGAFLVMYGLGFVLLFILAIVVILAAHVAEWTADNTQEMEASFHSFTDDGALCFYENGESTPFYVYGASEQTVQFLKSSCADERTFLLYVEVHGSPARYIDVAELSTMDGEKLISFDEANQAHRRDNGTVKWAMLSILLILLLLWTGFVVLSIKVGCDPEKYSPFVVSCLYRKNSIALYPPEDERIP
jgi:hypothetical protein